MTRILSYLFAVWLLFANATNDFILPKTNKLIRRLQPSLTTSTKSVIFKNGEEGYKCYRIPVILLTTDGTLIAFAEGRMNSCSDKGYIDIVYKRSFDYGESWSALSVLYSDSTSNINTIGNPCPVQDVTTNKIWVIFCKNNYQIYTTYSTDDGATFSSQQTQPVELTNVNDPNWEWVATGPSTGIQLMSGRLVVPFNYHFKGEAGAIKNLYSDDNGESWQTGEPNFGPGGVHPGESQAVQLGNGNVYVNSRTGIRSPNRLGSVFSDDGTTLVDTRIIPQLVDVGIGCNAAMIRTSLGVLYYSGILSAAADRGKDREDLNMYYSVDEGNNWNHMVQVEAGGAAYSSLVDIQKEDVLGILYETWEYEYIYFKKYPKMITNGNRFKVLSVDHAAGADGIYFNFYAAAVNMLLGRTDWDGERLYIFNHRTQTNYKVAIWSNNNGGSIGDAHGRKEPKELTPQSNDWVVGDELEFVADIEDCRIHITGNDHKRWSGDQERIGMYFAFNKARADCILGNEFADGAIMDVFYSGSNSDRKVIIWRTDNVFGGDAHGRQTDGAQKGDWQIGEYIEFVGASCNHEC